MNLTCKFKDKNKFNVQFMVNGKLSQRIPKKYHQLNKQLTDRCVLSWTQSVVF